MVSIPRRVIAMLYIEGYFAEVGRLVRDGHTHIEAYLLAEQQLQNFGLPSRYDSYPSFKRGKAHHSGKGDGPDILFW